MSTPVTLIGNIVDDPELRFTPSGAAVANLRLAVNERRKNATTGEWEDGDTSFYKVTVWRQAAENVTESLSKGLRVIVHGDLKLRQFERQDGTKGLSAEVDARNIGPDLTFATATVKRLARAGTGAPAAAAPDAWTTTPAAAGVDASEPPF